MINEGDFLKSPAMRSFAAATGTPRAMPACSISTTTGATTRTTTSGSADPRIESRLDSELAQEKQTIFGRKPPGDSPKAWPCAEPETVAGLTSAAAGSGQDSLFARLTSLENLSIKKIALLDVLREESMPSVKNADDRFDGNFTLFTGEMANLLADLVAVLGGRLIEQEAKAA